MYTSFHSINWKTLASCHYQRWNFLKDTYNLTPSNYGSQPTLDQIAQDCIAACTNLLFPADTANIVPFSEFLMDANVKNKFVISLSDHLIVSFSHRFFCDNLVQKNINECLEAMFNCTLDNVSPSDGTPPPSTSPKYTFIKLGKRAFSSWKDTLCDTSTLCSKYHLKSPIPISPDELLAPPNWLFSLSIAHHWWNSPLAIPSKPRNINRGNDTANATDTNVAEKASNEPTTASLFKAPSPL